MIRQLDTGLLRAIERKMKGLRVDPESFVIDTKVVRVTSETMDIALDGDIYFLANDTLDLEYTARVKLSSTDNYEVLSQTNYQYGVSGTYISFRDYLAIRVENYDPNNFKTFNLTFYAIRPILN